MANRSPTWSAPGTSSLSVVANYQWTIASVMTVLAVLVFTINTLFSNQYYDYQHAIRDAAQPQNPSTLSSMVLDAPTHANAPNTLFANIASNNNKLLESVPKRVEGANPTESAAAATAASVSEPPAAYRFPGYDANDPRLQFLFQEYQPEILYSMKSNYVQVGTSFYKPVIESSAASNRLISLSEVDFCRSSTLLNLLNIAQNPRVNISRLYPRFAEEVLQPYQVSSAFASPSSSGSAVSTASSPAVAATRPGGAVATKRYFPLSVDISDVMSSSDALNSHKGEILIVYTTCNQLSMTVLSLQYLRNTDKIADIIVVDDHSTDGTVEYLRKKGFAVITKPVPTGLTDSWNIGYRLAVGLGYKHVIFTNNDVLLTAGAVHLMYYGLKAHSLVVPLTTDKGSGHHKLQSIMKAHKLPASMMPVVDDYRNAEFVQETLLRKYVYVPKEKRRCPAQQSINEKNQPKFNGFCFAVNIEKIEAAAFEPKVHLFDPKDRIVGQEDSLTQRMEKANLYPILLHCSFVFHFKSRTVSAANFTYFQELLHRNNATVVEKASYPTVLIEYKPEKNKKYTFAVDIRENLQWYHPTDGASGSPTLSQPKDTDGAAFMQGLMRRSKDLAGYRNRHPHVPLSQTDLQSTSSAQDAQQLYTPDERVALDVWQTSQQLFCRANKDDILFPSIHAGNSPSSALSSSSLSSPSSSSSSSKRPPLSIHGHSESESMDANSKALTSVISPTGNAPGGDAQGPDFYRRYPDMSFNIRNAPYCIFPSQWPAYCEKYLNIPTATLFEPELYAIARPTVTVIAIAMSDPVSTPSAGDIFTAYELGAALQQTYSHVKIRYLRRGPAWYAPANLHDVDVLITLLDNYDLTQVLGHYLDSSVPNYFESKTEFSCAKAGGIVTSSAVSSGASAASSSSSSSGSSGSSASSGKSAKESSVPLQLKPTLITIAWPRNWFHRWWTKPWFGNYDLVLTSSHLTKAFYVQLIDTVGVSVSCGNNCPQKAPQFVSPILPAHHRPTVRATSISSNSNSNSKNQSNGNGNGNSPSSKSRHRALLSTTQDVYEDAAETNDEEEDVLGVSQPFEQEAVVERNLHHHHFRHRSLLGANHNHNQTRARQLLNMDAPQAKWQLFSHRLHSLPVHVFPLATSLRYIRPSLSSPSSSSSSSSSDSASSTTPSTAKRSTGAAEPESASSVSEMLSAPTNASLQAKALFGKVDYIFTGSYFRSYRRIMDFDPASLPAGIQGRIVGKNWQMANVSKAWKEISTGFLPYEVVKESYKYVKIVIDDANHVTAPWGSTNSRVFDATASGALVLSNGEIGMREIFGGIFRTHTTTSSSSSSTMTRLPIPIFENAAELTQLLTYYLTHEQERRQLVALMQAHVLEAHTYLKRASQLGEILAAQFALKLNPRKSHKLHHGLGSSSNNGNSNGMATTAATATHGESARSHFIDRRVLRGERQDDVVTTSTTSSLSTSSSTSSSTAAATAIEATTNLVEVDPSMDVEDAEQQARTSERMPQSEQAQERRGRVLLSKPEPAGNAGAASKPHPPLPSNAKPSNAAAGAARAASSPSSSSLSLSSPPSSSGLCIGVRTTDKHEEWLPIFIRSLIIQHSKSKYRDSFPLQVFIVDTEAKRSFAEFLIDFATKHNERFKYPYIHVVFTQATQEQGVKNSVYGYDDTDKLLEVMLSQRQCGGVGNGLSSSSSSSSTSSHPDGGNYGNGSMAAEATVPRLKVALSRDKHTAHVPFPLSNCEWIMFSNGDNMYNAAWFNTVAPLALSPDYDILGWDFITHHPRNGTSNTPITVAFERRFMDLASVMIRADLYAQTNMRFLRETAFTKDMFARDIVTILALLEKTQLSRTKLLHQTLLMHQ